MTTMNKNEGNSTNHSLEGIVNGMKTGIAVTMGLAGWAAIAVYPIITGITDGTYNSPPVKDALLCTLSGYVGQNVSSLGAKLVGQVEPLEPGEKPTRVNQHPLTGYMLPTISGCLYLISYVIANELSK